LSAANEPPAGNIAHSGTGQGGTSGTGWVPRSCPL